MNEFEKLVRHMREKYKEFLKSRNKEALQQAKVLERSLDAYLLEKNKVENQSKLDL
jgi:hypothetical protein